MAKRRNWLSLLFITLPLLLSAQRIDKKVLLQDIKYLGSEELAGRKPLTQESLMAREYIKQRFDSLGLTSQYADFTQFFSLKGNGEKQGKAANIIGFIPGQESSKIIVITAHYDHLGREGDKTFYGADDNASGTAGLLALAAYFSVNKPRHSIMFAAVDAEELGLLGARALVKDFPFPLENVLLNINMDMISRSEKGELYAAGTIHYPELLPLLKESSESAKINLKFGHDQPGTGSDDWTNASDHAAFHEKGIPFIYFGVEDHQDYHKSTDTYENIDPEFFYHAVELIVKCVETFDENL